MTNNLVDIKTHFKDFSDANLIFSVSSRNIRPDIDIIHHLKIIYIYCDIKQIENVFGHTFIPSRLYGGRIPKKASALTLEHISRMEEYGIGLALTMTNHFFDNDAYRESLGLLKRYHKKGNSIICTNDELAIRVRNDFPDYELKASAIKNISTIEEISEALQLYDSLTLPMDKNNDDDLLNAISEKNRIILFGNAACAYQCPERSCYLGFSQKIFGRPVTTACSRKRVMRLDRGQVFFNVNKLFRMGFHRFKLVPLAPVGSENAALHFSKKISTKK